MVGFLAADANAPTDLAQSKGRMTTSKDASNLLLASSHGLIIPRIPPRMTPTKLKSLLSEFGEVTRVYLVEEDKMVHQRQRKQGGSGSKRFTEGWVEFAKKKVAKHVAASLNTTPISNYKRSAHYGEFFYKHKRKFDKHNFVSYWDTSANPKIR